MASKKDYIVVARALAQVRESYGKNWDANLFRASNDHVEAIANAFANDNPAFDRARFLKAAGWQS